jgi:hypothetical protein
MLKEGFMVYFKLLPRHFPGNTEEYLENLRMIVDVRVQIRTGNIPV